MRKIYILLIYFCLKSSLINAQLPQIGAEVWIESGQTKEQIDEFFRLMSDYKMTTARLFIMWNQIEPHQETYIFTNYDHAFKAAEKYGIKVVATLTASEPPPCRNKRSFYLLHTYSIFEDESELSVAANYIKQVVDRYKNSKALEYWWLTNEPGQWPVPSRLT